ncbi:MAG: hypothetical protein ACI4MT_05540 [Christensenellales bacterium]
MKSKKNNERRLCVYEEKNGSISTVDCKEVLNGSRIEAEDKVSAVRGKNKRQKRIQKGGIFVVIIVTLSFIVTVAACGIYNGGIMKGIVLGESGGRYYLLSMGTFDDITLARQEGALNKKQGGAGYVLKYGDKYHIIAAIYDNESDAEKVQSKQRETTEIIGTALQKFSGMAKWHKQGENAVSVIASCFDTLADIIVKRVDNEISVNESKSKLLLMIGKISRIQSEFEKVADTDEALNFNARLEAVVSMIEELRKSECEVGGLRYLQVAIIVLFCGD